MEEFSKFSMKTFEKYFMSNLTIDLKFHIFNMNVSKRTPKLIKIQTLRAKNSSESKDILIKQKL
jgi:hypothetical protein